jgi:hypothetical protein
VLRAPVSSHTVLRHEKVEAVRPKDGNVLVLRQPTPSRFLQHYVVPLCVFSHDGQRAHPKSFCGTAFFVNQHGCFLTAGHALARALKDVHELGPNHFVGLFVKDGESREKHQASPVLRHDLAPKPADVAVGVAACAVETPLRLKSTAVNVWQEVAALGYPENALNREESAFWFSIRGHRGYVQRELTPDHFGLPGHPSAFELSFPITAGLSGAPVFINRGRFDIVVGVCVGSHSSRILQYSHEEVTEGGHGLREIHHRIEEYGIAHDLRPLLGWKPEIGLGLTLEQFAGLQFQAMQEELETAGGKRQNPPAGANG